MVPFLSVALLFSLSPAPVQVREPVARASATVSAPTCFVGRVLGPNHRPIAGVCVTTSAGGEAVTGADGSFALALDVPLLDACVEVTATSNGRAASGVLSASVRVRPSALSTTTDVGRLVLAPSLGSASSWLPTFGQAPGADGDVRTLAVFDDGRGPALYAGGEFVSMGGVSVNHVARWDGVKWSALGGGTDGPVRALTVFDDGSGPALYVGGFYATAGGVSVNGVAKWDGANWSPLGSGLSGGSGFFVRCLAVFDSGSGAALYAGGDFTGAGGVSARKIARWDGVSWTGLGSGLMAGDLVNTLAVFDDGSGAALYVGGRFPAVGGVATESIGRWDGSTWSAVGSGMGGFPRDVDALTVFDDGSGSALYAGGLFTSAGGTSASRIARWDGSTWSALASGVSGRVEALTVSDLGTGPALYAGGLFTTAGGQPASRLARWDGSTWSSISVDTDNDVFALAGFDAGAGTELYAAGHFKSVESAQVNRIARWNGSLWKPLGSGLDGEVVALTLFDSGSGPQLHAGGRFTIAGGESANGVARFGDQGWTALGSGMNGAVRALCSFDDGSGPALFAGGDFSRADGVPALGIACWRGSSWEPLGSGLDHHVACLAVFDDGGGPALFVGGTFANAGGAPASFIARWDGASWSALGSGISGVGSDPVRALAVFDDGSGPALFVGGSFSTAGGQPAARIAKWDGASWSSLPVTLFGGAVDALTVFDDGSGAALYAGGAFTNVGGLALNRVARWDGTDWSPLGSGMEEEVLSLAVHDDGSGSALYAGGAFLTAGGLAANHIARWDGSSWSSLGGGLTGQSDNVQALAVLDRNGPVLCAGGHFATSTARDSFVAAWGSRVREQEQR